MATDAPAATQAILHFWFDDVGPDRWWTRSAVTDDAIRTRFLPLWEEWRTLSPDGFLASGETALAAILLFDQFPRNMFRGDARAFATDGLALAIADGAVARGLDRTMPPDARSFLYLPFMHAEDLAMQDRCVALFEVLGLPESTDYARKHRAIIARHGRFPARNAALGRATRPDEQEAIAASQDW